MIKARKKPFLLLTEPKIIGKTSKVFRGASPMSSIKAWAALSTKMIIGPFLIGLATR